MSAITGVYAPSGYDQTRAPVSHRARTSDPRASRSRRARRRRSPNRRYGLGLVAPENLAGGGVERVEAPVVRPHEDAVLPDRRRCVDVAARLVRPAELARRRTVRVDPAVGRADVHAPVRERRRPVEPPERAQARLHRGAPFLRPCARRTRRRGGRRSRRRSSRRRPRRRPSPRRRSEPSRRARLSPRRSRRSVRSSRRRRRSCRGRAATTPTAPPARVASESSPCPRRTRSPHRPAPSSRVGRGTCG